MARGDSAGWSDVQTGVQRAAWLVREDQRCFCIVAIGGIADPTAHLPQAMQRGVDAAGTECLRSEF
jgi:thiamine monophosphate synthase